jgi:hypothetical protein
MITYLTSSQLLSLELLHPDFITSDYISIFFGKFKPSHIYCLINSYQSLFWFLCNMLISYDVIVIFECENIVLSWKSSKSSKEFSLGKAEKNMNIRELRTLS